MVPFSCFSFCEKCSYISTFSILVVHILLQIKIEGIETWALSMSFAFPYFSDVVLDTEELLEALDIMSSLDMLWVWQESSSLIDRPPEGKDSKVMLETTMSVGMWWPAVSRLGGSTGLLMHHSWAALLCCALLIPKDGSSTAAMEGWSNFRCESPVLEPVHVQQCMSIIPIRTCIKAI